MFSNNFPKIKTDIICSVTIFRKSCFFYETNHKWQFGACTFHAVYWSL